MNLRIYHRWCQIVAPRTIAALLLRVDPSVSSGMAVGACGSCQCLKFNLVIFTLEVFGLFRNFGLFFKFYVFFDIKLLAFYSIFFPVLVFFFFIYSA